MRVTNSMPVASLRWKRWLFLLLAAVAFYVLLPQVGTFHSSWRALRQAHAAGLLMAALFIAATYLAAAATYCLLAVKQLRYGRTLLVQVAGVFASRLLPAGVGGIGVNYAYLRKAKHTPAQAASVAAVNNTLGFIGHLLLVGSVLLIEHGHLMSLRMPTHVRVSWLAVVLVGLSFVTVIVWSQARQRLIRGFRQVVSQIFVYRRHPGRLLAALLTSVSLTLCNVLSLYYSALALKLDISVVSILVIFTLGIAIGTVTPTPGGLGGVEAGLLAGLIAYQVPGTEALAVVLVYRFLSYWLTLAVGAAAFAVARNREYF